MPQVGMQPPILQLTHSHNNLIVNLLIHRPTQSTTHQTNSRKKSVKIKYEN